MKRARIKLLQNSRVPYMATRVKQIDIPHEESDEAKARRDMRWTPRWSKLRFRMKHREPICQICLVAPSTTLDHLLGHTDDQAMAAAEGLHLKGVNPSWKVRFWEGPFLLSCSECHSKKTRFEMSGRLLAWLDKWKKGELRGCKDD